VNVSPTAKITTTPCTMHLGGCSDDHLSESTDSAFPPLCLAISAGMYVRMCYRCIRTRMAVPKLEAPRTGLDVQQAPSIAGAYDTGIKCTLPDPPPPMLRSATGLTAPNKAQKLSL
jgi:hypothetical protein